MTIWYSCQSASHLCSCLPTGRHDRGQSWRPEAARGHFRRGGFSLPQQILSSSVMLHHALRTTHHAPCTMHHAPCIMHHAPCTMHHAPWTMYHARKTTFVRPSVRTMGWWWKKKEDDLRPSVRRPRDFVRCYGHLISLKHVHSIWKCHSEQVSVKYFSSKSTVNWIFGQKWVIFY